MKKIYMKPAAEVVLLKVKSQILTASDPSAMIDTDADSVDAEELESRESSFNLWEE